MPDDHKARKRNRVRSLSTVPIQHKHDGGNVVWVALARPKVNMRVELMDHGMIRKRVETAQQGIVLEARLEKFRKIGSPLRVGPDSDDFALDSSWWRLTRGLATCDLCFPRDLRGP